MTATTRPASVSVNEPTLYVAFELGKKEWKLALTSGFGIEPVVRTVPARDLARRSSAALQRGTAALRAAAERREW